MGIRFRDKTEKLLELIEKYGGRDGTRFGGALRLIGGPSATRYAQIYHFHREGWLKPALGNRYLLSVGGFKGHFELDSDPEMTVSVDDFSFSDGSSISFEALLARYPQGPRAPN